MASELSITQNFRQLTLTLLADSVMVDIDVKTLKGQYTYSLNNNYTDLSFTPWSEDHEPSESFQKIVRETQIEPNSYYLETIMRQSLVNNFAINCNCPKVNTIEQDTQQDAGPSRQSPCPSNWSDYLHVENDTNNESQDQTEPPTEADPDQPTTSGSIHVPQDPHADLTTILRLPKTKALTIKKGKGKCGNTETMPIVVYGDATQLWEQMPSPPKARPPFATWAMIKPQRQIQDDMECN